MLDIPILSAYEAMFRGHFRLLEYQRIEILRKHALGLFSRICLRGFVQVNNNSEYIFIQNSSKSYQYIKSFLFYDALCVLCMCVSVCVLVCVF